MQPHFPLKNVKFKEQIPYPVNFERYDSERKKLDPKHRIFSVSFTLKNHLVLQNYMTKLTSYPCLLVAYFYPFEGDLFSPSPHISGLIWAAVLLSAAVLGI